MMRYAIASHAMLATVDIDPRTFEVADWNVLSQGYHYGIGVEGSDGPAAVLRAYRGGDSPHRQSSPSLLTFDHHRGTAGAVSSLDGFGDVHQLVPHAGGWLVADTQHDRIVFLGGAERFTWSFGDDDSDVHHVNSIFPAGRTVLAMLHNRRRRESQIAVLEFDPDRGFDLVALLSLWDILCHNVYVEGDRLLYNASYVNELVLVDLSEDRVARRVRLDAAAAVLPGGRGHAKGLSVSGDHVALGVSEEASRDHRPTSQGALMLLDRRELEMEALVPLDMFPFPVGNINEVRRLDRPDLAQGAPHLAPRDWRSLRLAGRQPLQRGMVQLRGRLLQPAFRLKARIDDHLRQ
jgi:hypothetical protein